MKTRYELPQGRYFLSRDRDGAGDAGGSVEAVWLDDDDKVQIEKNVLEIGKACKCGSIFTRTFGNDWWMTTPITEFLEVNEEKHQYKFKTGNSIYSFGIG